MALPTNRIAVDAKKTIKKSTKATLKYTAASTAVYITVVLYGIFDMTQCIMFCLRRRKIKDDKRQFLYA